MNKDELRHYCLSKTGTIEDFPFGAETAVYKVMGKMFALVPLDVETPSISVKCDPAEAIMLRQMYPDHVQPGYYLNKKHWNTVIVDGTVPDDDVQAMITDSYILVRKKLTKADRQALDELETADTTDE